jgi:2-polyprenyl-3-methyl-5-hydroxy-6-metoxy-1,4-benzoquinol methylase
VEEVKDWFELNVKPLEKSYLKGVTPWQRSGVGLHNPRSEEYWKAVRWPIVDAIGKSGSVLDIGCANGYLLESLQNWLEPKGITMEPHGLDISAALLEEAKQRVPEGTFHLANVWGWKAPRKYDFVLTELVYVPEKDRQFYLRGLLRDAVEPEGKLIVSQYGSDLSKSMDLTSELLSMRLHAVEQFEGDWEGVQKTAVCAIAGLGVK